MGITYSPNLGLAKPDGAELVSNGPSDFSQIVNVLDGGANGPTASLYRKGTLASRPAANTVPLGGVYQCTDASAIFYSDGSAWHYIPIDATVAPLGSVQGYAGTSDPVDADGTTRWMIPNGRAISRTTYAALFALLGTTFGAGDGSTTFNIPDLRSRSIVGAGQGSGLSSRTLGSTGGEENHTLSSGEIPSHTHGVGSLAIGQENSHTHNVGSLATVAESPAHSHYVSGTTGNDSPGHGHNIGGQALGATSAPGTIYADPGDGFGPRNQIRIDTANPNNTGTMSLTEPGSYNQYSGGYYVGAPTNSHQHSFAANTSTAAHTHGITGATSNGSAHTHTLSGTTDSGSGSTPPGGGGHNNMQPFLALNYIIRVQ